MTPLVHLTQRIVARLVTSTAGLGDDSLHVLNLSLATGESAQLSSMLVIIPGFKAELVGGLVVGLFCSLP